MAFVKGLMGPYMRPIPIGASAAMLFSLLVAFIVTPWATLKLIKREGEIHHAPESWTTRFYRKVMRPLIYRPVIRSVFLFGTVALAFAIAFLPLKWVTVKMLPFDNKSEFQIIIDMDEGTTLEETARVAREIGDYLATVPEVTDYQLYIGTAAPFNFNGLVRHYYLRRGSNVADIQVNLLPKHERKSQSHDIAKRIRPAVQKIAEKYGARVKVVEVPPGRQSFKPLSPKSTVQITKSKGRSPSKSFKFSKPQKASWMPIGIWRLTKLSGGSRLTRKRLPCTA